MLVEGPQLEVHSLVSVETSTLVVGKSVLDIAGETLLSCFDLCHQLLIGGYCKEYGSKPQIYHKYVLLVF